MRAPINPASPLSYRSGGGEKKRELPEKRAFSPKKGGIGRWKRTKADKSWRSVRTSPQVAVPVQPAMQPLILRQQLRPSWGNPLPTAIWSWTRQPSRGKASQAITSFSSGCGWTRRRAGGRSDGGCRGRWRAVIRRGHERARGNAARQSVNARNETVLAHGLLLPEKEAINAELERVRSPTSSSRATRKRLTK